MFLVETVHHSHDGRERPTPSIEFGTNFLETARDPAGDRPGRDVEHLADRAVALVAAEEAVEDLAARVADLVERGAHRHRVVELAEHVVDLPLVRVGVRRRVAGVQAQPVDAEPARELGEPRPDGVVVPQLRQPLERAGENLLEDVLRVLLRQPEAAPADRVDVA